VEAVTMPGISVHILGSGNAFNSDGRGSHAVLIDRRDGATILVDAGPTVGLSIEQFRVDSESIDTVFFTHLHGDHVAGWPFLFLRLVYLDRRTRPLDVYGPVGVRQTLEGLVGLCYGEIAGSGQAVFEIRYHELPVEAATAVECGVGVIVDIEPMDHHETSIGYRFEMAGSRIAVSGDTRWCEGVEELASKADLLILECTTVEPGEAKHISLADVREHRSRLKDCATMLVHTSDAVAQAFEADPIDRVMVADDGLRLEM